MIKFKCCGFKRLIDFLLIVNLPSVVLCSVPESLFSATSIIADIDVFIVEGAAEMLKPDIS